MLAVVTLALTAFDNQSARAPAVSRPAPAPVTSAPPDALVLATVGNAINSLYVFSLPLGPIWFLHTFYLISTAFMLGWYLRYGVRKPTHSAPAGMSESPDAVGVGVLLRSPHSS